MSISFSVSFDRFCLSRSSRSFKFLAYNCLYHSLLVLFIDRDVLSFIPDFSNLSLFSFSLFSLPKGLLIFLNISRNKLLVSLIFSLAFLFSISFISALIFIISFLLLSLGLDHSSFSRVLRHKVRLLI